MKLNKVRGFVWSLTFPHRNQHGLQDKRCLTAKQYGVPEGHDHSSGSNWACTAVSHNPLWWAGINYSSSETEHKDAELPASLRRQPRHGGDQQLASQMLWHGKINYSHPCYLKPTDALPHRDSGIQLQSHSPAVAARRLSVLPSFVMLYFIPFEAQARHHPSYFCQSKPGCFGNILVWKTLRLAALIQQHTALTA